MSTEKPTPSELTALWILMTAKTWGAAIGAIAEGEPQVVEMLAAHDREIAAQTSRIAELEDERENAPYGKLKAQLTALRERSARLAEVLRLLCDHPCQVCQRNIKMALLDAKPSQDTKV